MARRKRSGAMKPLTITIPSARNRVAVLSSDKHMRPIATGQKIAPVMKRARQALHGKEPLLVIVPKKNVTHIF
jgi:hypothetical protein